MESVKNEAAKVPSSFRGDQPIPSMNRTFDDFLCLRNDPQVEESERPAEMVEIPKSDAPRRSLAGQRLRMAIVIGFEICEAGRNKPCPTGRNSKGRFSFLFPNRFMATATRASAAPSSTKPVKTFRHRGISASVFENHTQTDGQDVSFYKISLQRTYRDGEEWKRSSNFSRDDVPVVQYVLQQAWQFVLETEAAPNRDETDS